MKKVLSILLCVASVLVFCAFPFGMAVFADDVVTSVVDFGKDVIQNYSLPGIVYKYLNSSQKKLEAARSYYFYMLCNDTLYTGHTIFDSCGYKFTDDILNYYYEQYVLASTGSSDTYFSDGDIYLSAAGFPDTRFSLRLLGFSTTNFNDFKNYYNSFLARYLLEQGVTATDPNPGKSGLDIAPGYVTSDELVEGIELDNSLYTAKDYKSIISYRSDKNYEHYETSYYVNRYSTRSNYTPVLMYSSCLFGGGANDVYLLPFYKSTNDYLSQYQLHLIFETVTDDSGNTQVLPQIKMWNNIDETEADAVDLIDSSSQKDFTDIKYFRLYFEKGHSRFRIIGHKTLDRFLSTSDYDGDLFITVSNNCKLLSSDFSKSLYFNDCITGNTHNAYGLPSEHDSDSSNSCSFKGSCDVGFYTSDKPISTTYQFIDTTKIAPNQIVTINGDTIYNYTITNPDTGESNTINEYVTNNYTYITNNNGGEAGGSGVVGGVGGNVTVGGQIDVGGSVGVDINVSVPDININVNGNGGAGGSGSLPDTDLVDNLPEAPSGFIDYTASLFSFLPAEILSLLIAGLAAAIFCRIWGR